MVSKGKQHNTYLIKINVRNQKEQYHLKQREGNRILTHLQRADTLGPIPVPEVVFECVVAVHWEES